MSLFRKKTKKRAGRAQDPFTRQEEQLGQQIKQLESFIETAPGRIRKKMEEDMMTMPPPDDLQDRRREHAFYAKLSRGEIKNERRYQARSAMLFLLLATAIAALSSWIYSFLNGI